MYAAIWATQSFCGGIQVFDPANTLLLLDRNAIWIDTSLERIGPLELVPGPKLRGAQAQGQPDRTHSKAGMQQDSAACIERGPKGQTACLDDADGRRISRL